MRPCAPFQPDDLAALGRFFCAAERVVPMRDIHAGQRDPDVIGLRHDVDNVFAPALEMARWEADRGYRSTYFILHGSPYWDAPELQSGLEEIADLGHEIGVHCNAIAEAFRTGTDPHELLAAAIDRLRSWGHEIVGTVAHGDQLCYRSNGIIRFVNDEIFTECVRDGARVVDGVPIDPRPLSDFGLAYDANWLGRTAYLSDSGGRWNSPGYRPITAGFPYVGQLHMLVHPDWWGEAFEPARAAA